MVEPISVQYLTTYDVQQKGEVHFSGCLIYDLASEEAVVRRFVDKMRRINKYLIFVDPYKDILWGRYEMDALSQIIDERCAGRVLIFLTRTGHFTDVNMNFAVHYTKQLDSIGRRRCLIPVRCYENVDYPRLLKGIHKIDMYANAYSQDYWLQQSKQFIPSFSSNGPLREECIQYNSSYNCDLDENQDLQSELVEDHLQINGTVEDSKSKSSSIFFQNTSFDSSQDRCKDGKISHSVAGNSIKRSIAAAGAVSFKETDKKVHTKKIKETEPHMRKGKKKNMFKMLGFFFKANN